MDESQFLKNERANEYEARFQVSGEVRITISAESLEEARRKAQDMMTEEDFGIELDEADEVKISTVFKTRPMFLATRDGQTMQVSRLDDGDQPRQPTEHGF